MKAHENRKTSLDHRLGFFSHDSGYRAGIVFTSTKSTSFSRGHSVITVSEQVNTYRTHG